MANVFDQFDQWPPPQPMQAAQAWPAVGGAPQAPEGNPFDQFDAAGEKPAFSGSLLPFSRDASGKVSFDSNAGIVGTVKRAMGYGRDVMSGQVPLPGTGNIPGSVSPDDPGYKDAVGRLVETVTLLNPVTPGMSAGGRMIPGMTRPQAPTAEALKGAASAGYTAARDMGVDYAPGAVAEMAQGVIQRLNHDGRIAKAAPKTHKLLAELLDPPEGSVLTIQGLEGARRVLNNIASDFAPKRATDRSAANEAIKALDGFLSAPPAEAVLAGPASSQARAIADARGNWAAAQRSDDIAGRVYNADVQAGASNSGQNIDNSIRQRLASLLKSDEQRAGYTPEEIAQIEKIVQGSKTGNALRITGNALGGGLGLGAQIPAVTGAVGAAVTGNPYMALTGALPLVGYGAKQLGNRLTRGKAEALDEATRMRSPLYESMPDVPAMSDASPAARAALIRLLMQERINAAQQ